MQTQNTKGLVPPFVAQDLVKRPSETKNRNHQIGSQSANSQGNQQGDFVEDYINSYIKRIEMRFMS